MNIGQYAGEIISGVCQELHSDITEISWAIVELVGLSSIILRVKEEINNHRSSRIRCNRSVIRIIGSVLPLKPVQRPYLRFVALGSLSTSCDSLFSTQTVQNYANFSNENERTLTSKLSLQDKNVPDFGLSLQNDHFEDDSPYGSGSELCYPHSSSPSANHVAAVNKISALEEELSQLRAQISIILSRGDNTTIFTPPPTPYLEIVSCVPPPPPPPPPPICCTVKKMSSDSSSLTDLIAKGKECINRHTKPIDIPRKESLNQDEPVSMSEVLKGLNNVKLKKVARSPGGTPIREKPVGSPTDAASIIAAALKKRFARIHIDSPEKDSEDLTNEFFSSPESTPVSVRKDNSFCSKFENSIDVPNTNSGNSLPMFKKVPSACRKLQSSSVPSVLPFGQHLLRKTNSPHSASAHTKSNSSR